MNSHQNPIAGSILKCHIHKVTQLYKQIKSKLILNHDNYPYLFKKYFTHDFTPYKFIRKFFASSLPLTRDGFPYHRRRAKVSLNIPCPSPGFSDTL